MQINKVKDDRPDISINVSLLLIEENVWKMSMNYFLLLLLRRRQSSAVGRLKFRHTPPKPQIAYCGCAVGRRWTHNGLTKVYSRCCPPKKQLCFCLVIYVFEKVHH